MGFIEAAFKPGHNCLNDGTVLADRKLPEVFVIIVEGGSMSLGKAKSQGRQFLAALYPADLEECPTGAPKEWRLSMCSPVTWRVKLIEA